LLGDGVPVERVDYHVIQASHAAIGGEKMLYPEGISVLDALPVPDDQLGPALLAVSLEQFAERAGRREQLRVGCFEVADHAA
jgi:hypothetical protein